MTEVLLRLEYKPKATSEQLMQLEKMYTNFTRMVSGAEAALSAARNYPKLEELVIKLRDTDRQLRELLMAQSDKVASVNITGESPSPVDTLNDVDSSTSMVKKATAKRLARRLYSIHHPDKGGSVSLFNTIRKAVEGGDLETLLFFRLKNRLDDCTPEDVSTLLEKLRIKSDQFQGKPAWKITQAFFSNKDRYVDLYAKVLELKIYELNMRMFGLTVSNSTEPQ